MFDPEEIILVAAIAFERYLKKAADAQSVACNFSATHPGQL
jgi:hypothetical protein